MVWLKSMGFVNRKYLLQDEIVSFEVVQEFAENNIIEFIPVEGADHRFRNERKMETAIKSILDFYDL